MNSPDVNKQANDPKVIALERSWLIINSTTYWFWPLLHHYWKSGLISNEDSLMPIQHTELVKDALARVRNHSETDPECRHQIDRLLRRQDVLEMTVQR